MFGASLDFVRYLVRIISFPLGDTPQATGNKWLRSCFEDDGAPKNTITECCVHIGVKAPETTRNKYGVNDVSAAVGFALTLGKHLDGFLEVRGWASSVDGLPGPHWTDFLICFPMVRLHHIALVAQPKEMQRAAEAEVIGSMAGR